MLDADPRNRVKVLPGDAPPAVEVIRPLQNSSAGHSGPGLSNRAVLVDPDPPEIGARVVRQDSYCPHVVGSPRFVAFRRVFADVMVEEEAASAVIRRLRMIRPSSAKQLHAADGLEVTAPPQSQRRLIDSDLFAVNVASRFRALDEARERRAVEREILMTAAQMRSPSTVGPSSVNDTPTDSSFLRPFKPLGSHQRARPVSAQPPRTAPVRPITPAATPSPDALRSEERTDPPTGRRHRDGGSKQRVRKERHDVPPLRLGSTPAEFRMLLEQRRVKVPQLIQVRRRIQAAASVRAQNVANRRARIEQEFLREQAELESLQQARCSRADHARILRFST